MFVARVVEHFPNSATAIHSVALDRTLNPPIGRQTSHRLLNEPFVANTSVSDDVMMYRWGVAMERTIGEKFKLALTICRDFMQGLFHQIFRGAI